MPSSTARGFIRAFFIFAAAAAVVPLAAGAARIVPSLLLRPERVAVATPGPAAPAPMASNHPWVTRSRAIGLMRPQSTLTGPTAGQSILGDAFSESASPPGAWGVAGTSAGNGCLTAGTNATPGTSIAACGSNATVDGIGQGALQVTAPAGGNIAMVVNKNKISTAQGLQITFDYYSFNYNYRAADGFALFLTDASQPLPTNYGGSGGGVGYSNVNGSTGIANGYLAVGLDEYGNMSVPQASGGGTGAAGGPGQVPETLAVRGAASQDYLYLGGATNSSNVAASLPFKWDQGGTSRPALPRTVRVTLTPQGLLTASVDIHDGNGFVTYYSKNIVGLQVTDSNAGGTFTQPAVPANVYVGVSGATGGLWSDKEVQNLNVSSLTSPGTFVPSQISNLAAWYDASNPSNVTTSNGNVSAWNDISGNGNTLVQATTGAQPKYQSSGWAGLGSINFAGAAFLSTANPVFSDNLYGASTVFVVANQANLAGSRAMAWSGVYGSNPRWALFSSNDAMQFQFNGTSGDLASTAHASGAAIWTAAGNSFKKLQYLHKNGNALGTRAAIAAPTGGTSPFSLGAFVGGGAGHTFFTGHISEVLVYNRYLSGTETNFVEGYLACKWGLRARLPENHPFRANCPQSAPPGTALPTPPPIAGSLQNPPEIRSSNGQLVFNVTAQKDATSGNPELSYNGSLIPPTLRLLPGDTLVVNYTNNLPTPAQGSPYTNNSNLHFHGLHVTPNAPGDDSIDMLAAPGQSLHYRVPIPANAPPGLFWYHTHAHGEAERQNLSGMSGALIVDGIAAFAPAVSSIPERVMVLRDAEPNGVQLPGAVREQIEAMNWGMTHATRGPNNSITANPYVLTDPNYRTFVRPAADTHCTTQEQGTKVWTLNGLATTNPQQLPTIGIRPGERQFWRVVNAGSDTFADLAVDNASLDIVAVDGVPIGNGKNLPAVMSVPHWILPPASRVEFIVTGPAAGTKTSYLRTNCFDDGPVGPPMPATALAALDPAHSSTDFVTQRVSMHRATAMHTADYVKAHTVARTQTIYYSDQNTINGVAYDPAGTPTFYAQSGTVEEWTIVNNSSQGHTFHTHQIHFLVEAINGITQSQQFMMDNVNIPPKTANGPGTVKILVDFTDPLVLGTFLIHCHVLSHEDGGMMAKIRVGSAPPLTLTPSAVTFKSAAAAPQTSTIGGGQGPYSITGCTGIVNASINVTKITMIPLKSGSCVLVVNDQTGLSGNISVTVQAAAPVVKLNPSSVSFASPTDAAQSVTISGGTPPYAPAGCTGVVTASITGTTLKVTPVAGGSCTITVSDSAATPNTNNLAVSVNVPQSGFPADNLTFHKTPGRTGWYNAETTLNTTNVASSNFKLQGWLLPPAGMPAMGKVYAQPLYASQELLSDGKSHNLVIVSTSTDQIYAFDDATRTVAWHRDFTNPGGGIRQQLWSDTGCPDVNPDVGITGTPVIDRNLDEMFVAVPTYENGTFHLRLHAISLKTGLDVTDSHGNPVGPTDITGTVAANGGTASIDPEWNYNRGGLLEANGNIYVALGSHCDYNAGVTHGWIVSYSSTTLQATGNIINLTADNQTGFYLGSPWMGGYGPAADSSGNIYFATGNGPDPGTNVHDFAMSILGVPGNLDLTTTVANGTWFSPASAAADSQADADLGSGGVVVFPDQTTGTVPHLLAQGGKCNTNNNCELYMLNRDNMGKQQSGDAGALVHFDSGCYMVGGGAYFADASNNQYFVYGCGPLKAYKLGLTPPSLTVATSSTFGALGNRDAGSQPIVSSNGTTAGTAVIWALQTAGNNGGNIRLVAYDALNMSRVAGPCTSTYPSQCIFLGSTTPPATTLTVAATTGATTFTVASLAGLAQGRAVTIGSGNSLEQLNVASINPSAKTFTTTTASANAHSIGDPMQIIAWSQAAGTAWIGEALVSPLVAGGAVYVPTDGGVAVFGLH